MADGSATFVLTQDDLRAVAGFAVVCARPVLWIFERDRPDDARPRDALASVQRFVAGGPRDRAIRDGAWAALRAAGDARDAGRSASSEAARAAVAAASAPFLHPLAKATQVKHILGGAAHAARAWEIESGDAAGVDFLMRTRDGVSAKVIAVLRRYPLAPSGGGRTGELLRLIDISLR